MHKWTFKFKFCKVIADNIRNAKKVYHDFLSLF
jgi:hypothetical protein